MNIVSRLPILFLLLSALPCRGQEIPPLSVRLNPSIQQLAGIRSRILRAEASMPARSAWAETLDPTPLIEAAAARRRLTLELQGAREGAALLQKRFLRLRHLGGIRLREREQAQKEWIEARTRREELEAELHTLGARITTRWGETLAGWTRTQGKHLAGLGTGKTALVRLVPGDGRAAFLCYRGKRIDLAYLSPAPAADPRLQAPAAFFLAPMGLPHGLRLDAWLEEAGQALPLPAAAVVWYGGQPWVYLQVDGESFVRRRLESYRDTGGLWWVSAGIEAGERVVVSGAQLLLAEEFRARVPEEDDDD